MDRTAITVALVGAAVSLAIAYLGHRRSRKVDATSAQSGVVSDHRAGTQQVIEGLNGLVNQLQEENERLIIRLDLTSAERDSLRLEVARLRKKYAANGE